MKRNAALSLLMALLMAIALSSSPVEAQETSNTPPSRHMTLQEAVQLALNHNHDIRIAGYTVEEKRQAKNVAKSSYFPSIRNDSSFLHVTDTELIQIKAGSLGCRRGERRFHLRTRSLTRAARPLQPAEPKSPSP